ncbi:MULTISPECIES: hypothetical protein [Marinobacter]|uniref:hypothetical protein n=1 Tax=Marinobacter TaxID=2742 RepID=UPI003B43597C|nr:hypothetical protein PBN92_07070 [Marinobacter alkaliphilus]
MTVKLKDLGIAFRKAKVDLYYSTNLSLFAIADYEGNLQRLLRKINGRSTVWVKDSDFLDTWTLASKTIKCPKVQGAGLIHAAPQDERIGGYSADGQRMQARGDNHQNCTTDEIDILVLRQFQSYHRSLTEGFKPMSGGVAASVSKDRKVLPKRGA